MHLHRIFFGLRLLYYRKQANSIKATAYGYQLSPMSVQSAVTIGNSFLDEEVDDDDDDERGVCNECTSP